MPSDTSPTQATPNFRRVEYFGVSFLVVDYRPRPRLNLDGYATAVPARDWSPELQDRSAPLGKRLPDDWTAKYYSGKYAGRYEPATVYRNLIKIANYASATQNHLELCNRLLRELMDLIQANSIVHEGARFIVRNFDLERDDHIMKAGWVNGISNGMTIRGLSRVQEVIPSSEVRDLMDQFALSYTILNTFDRPLSRPWFSFVDEDGFLWFDEHPADDGTASRVLNGHIHAVYGLYYYARHCREEWILDFLKGGLATVRCKGHEFRVPGNIPRYDLRPGYKPDYAPPRAIRQMKELARLTKDSWFDTVGTLFECDFKASEVARGGKKMPLARRAQPPF